MIRNTDNRQVIRDLLRGYPLPLMARVRQLFPRPQVSDVPAAVRAQLGPEILATVRPGMSIAVTAGSRGITNIAVILRQVCSILREQGARPFIIPAMGSHGGATAAGQREVLASLGVTEETCGAPIRSDMTTKYIGDTETGDPVYIDQLAAEADGIVVVNRVKAHTDFRGPYESGVMKMMTVGLGKQYGAEQTHRLGVERMAANIPLYGNAIIKHGPILFALAIVENAYDDTALLRALRRDEIAAVEPDLLKQANSLMGRILFDQADLLIIDRIGKNISGNGMDPNVSGAFPTPGICGGLRARRRVVLDLTDESHGSMMGLGLVDATTERCFNRCDLWATYANALTSTDFASARIPLVLPSDREAIQACLKYCGDNDKQRPRVIRIQDTAHLQEIWVSEAMLEEAAANRSLEILGKAEELPFNAAGNLW